MDKASPVHSGRKASTCVIGIAREMLHQFLESRFKYVVMRAQAGVDDASFNDLSVKVVAVLKQKLQEYPLPIDEATRITDMLMSAPITMSARDDCIDLLDQRQSRPKSGGSEEPQLRAEPRAEAKEKGFTHTEFLSMEPFAKEGLRNIMKNPALHPTAKLSAVAEMLVELELHQLTEKSYAFALAFIIGAQSDVSDGMVKSAGGQAALALVQELKELHLLYAKDLKHRGIKKMPLTTAGLWELDPALYQKYFAGEQPCVERINPLVHARLRAAVPCRKTKAGVVEDGKKNAADTKVKALERLHLETLMMSFGSQQQCLLGPGTPNADSPTTPASANPLAQAQSPSQPLAWPETQAPSPEPAVGSTQAVAQAQIQSHILALPGPNLALPLPWAAAGSTQAESGVLVGDVGSAAKDGPQQGPAVGDVGLAAASDSILQGPAASVEFAPRAASDTSDEPPRVGASAAAAEEENREENVAEEGQAQEGEQKPKDAGAHAVALRSLLAKVKKAKPSPTSLPANPAPLPSKVKTTKPSPKSLPAKPAPLPSKVKKTKPSPTSLPTKPAPLPCHAKAPAAKRRRTAGAAAAKEAPLEAARPPPPEAAVAGVTSVVPLKADAAHEAAAGDAAHPVEAMPPEPTDAGPVFYKKCSIFLKTSCDHWRIYMPTEIIAGGKSHTRQFGTAQLPATKEKISAAYRSALALIDEVAKKSH